MIERIKLKLSKDIHLTELLKGSFITFIFKVLGMVLGYMFTLFIAKWYGADSIGLYASSLTILNILVIIGILGFDNALVKFVAEFNVSNKKKQIKEIYQKVLILSLPTAFLLSIILYFQSDFLAIDIFKNEQLLIFFQITSFGIVPFVFLKINTAIFRGLKQMQEFSLFQNILIFFISNIILIYLHTMSNSDIVTNSNIVIIWSYIISIFFVSLFSFLSLNKKIFKPIRQNTDSLKYNNILKVSLPMALSSSIALIISWTDIIMLGILGTQEEVGIYFVIMRISTISNIALISVNSITAPKIAEAFAKKDKTNLKKISLQSVKLIFYITFPINILIFLFPEIILNFFGEKFLEAGYCLSILMIAQLINSLAGANGSLLYMTGKQVIDKNINLILMFLNIFLNYLMIPKFGILGAIYSTSTIIILKNIFLFIYIKKFFGFYMIFNPNTILK